MPLKEDNGWYEVIYICDSCGEERVTQRGNYRRMLKNSRGTFCRPCSGARNSYKLVGRVAWNKGNTTPPEEARRNPYIASDGYLVEWRPSSASYVKSHRARLEEHLGRELTRDEIVHHIDGNKLNNDVKNLWLYDRHEHKNIHQTIQEIGYTLVKLGLVSFQNGNYVADGKLRELLEQPEAANQQPSQDSNDLEGSETKGESHVDDNSL